MSVTNAAAQPSDRHSDRVEQTMSVSAGQRISGGRSAPESMGPCAAHSPDPERAVGLGARAAVGRTSRRRLQLIRDALSERDWTLLTTLDRHGYLTTLQLQRLHFADHATSDAAGRVCRRVLQRLAEQRVIEHLERRVGGIRAGSASYVWRLGPIGDRLLTQTADGRPRARRKEPSLHHLDHRLDVAEMHIRLLEAARNHRCEVLRVQLEPDSWRRYLSAGAAHAVLKPDLYAVTANDVFEDHWFIEVDRGTESLPTLLRKCAQYEGYRATGIEQRDGGVFPLVLWLLPNEQRVGQLRTAIRHARGLDEQLYRLTTPSGLIELLTGGSA